MKGYNISRTFKVLLVALVAFTSVFVFNTITSAEDFDISAEITYSEDGKTAVISLDATNIGEDYTLEEVKDSNGNSMDLMNLNYSVNENGLYEFTVVYYDNENEKVEYTKVVEVDGIKEEEQVVDEIEDLEEVILEEEKVIDRSGLLRASVDYSSQVKVTDWNLYDSTDTALSATNLASNGKYYRLITSWTLTPSGGATIQSGDTAIISVAISNSNSGDWTIINSDWEPFEDSTSSEIGRWRIKDRKIEIEFTANATGLSSVSADFITGAGAVYCTTKSGGNQNVTMAGITKVIGFTQVTLRAMGSGDTKYVWVTSNSQIQWRTEINNNGLKEISTKTWGGNFTTTDTYFEDKLTGGASFSSINIQSSMTIPVDLTDGAASTDAARNITITSKFTRVYQTSGQSYASFKSSLSPLEWGVYEDESTGEQTVVVYFGTIGNNGIKYSDADSSFAVSAATASILGGFYTESDRSTLEAYFSQTYGNSNSINGNVCRYLVYLYTDYDKVMTDTTKTNTATVIKDGSEKNYTGTGILQGNLGTVSVSKNTAAVYKYDEDDMEPLSGATFKLQIYNSSSSTWSDYTSQTNVTTGSDGFATTGTLGVGTYRFVEVSAPTNYCKSENESGCTTISLSGYDSTLDTIVSDEFTIATTDTEGALVTVGNQKKRFTITYTPGTQGTFINDEHEDIYINESTPTYSGTTGSDGKPAGNVGYTFNGWSPTVSSTVTADATYVAQWSANTDTAYKVEHYLEQPNGLYTLKDKENKTGTTATTVTATPNSYAGYTYDDTISGTKVNGVVAGDGSLVLKLYYTANTDTVYKVEHHLEQPDGTYTLKETESKTGMTGATATATPNSYAGYTYDDTVSGSKASGVIAGDGSLVLKLYYTANTNTVYKVEHHLEQPDGTYTLKETENKSGMTGATATAVSKTYAGYTYDSTVSGTITSGVIAGDGSLVLKLYYIANTDTAYKVEHYLEQPDGSYLLKDIDDLTGITGGSVTATANVYAGYTVNLFHVNTVLSGNIKGDGSLTLKLYYEANINTAYKVEHYLEQPDGSYVLEDTDNLTGTTGASVTAIAKTYEGYTLDNTVSGTIESGNILGDGSLVLKLYYTANTDTEYKVDHYQEQLDGTYELVDVDNLSGTTGSSVIASPKTYAGYTFDNTITGTVENGTILRDGSLVLKLYYTLNTDTVYKVEHHLEQDDKSYKLHETETLAGTTGSTVNAIEKTYDGYEFDKTVKETISSGTVDGDGTLVLKLYYNKEPELTITTTPVHSNPSLAGGVNAVNTADDTDLGGYAETMLISLLAVLFVLHKKKVLSKS